jgi:O-antigen/teichoic acid export membrane protein
LNNLGKQVRTGFGWDLVGTFFKQISVLIVSVILARILDPEQFGIIGMAMVFVSLSQVFVDVGFTQGLIQNKNNNQTIYSTIFYINIIMALLIALIIYMSAPLIGAFYESNQVANVVRWLCFIPLITSFGSVHASIFTRNLNFKVLAFRTIISTIAGGIVGVFMALYDYGVYALVGQQLTSAFLFCTILWWKSIWRPTLEFSFKEIKGVFDFSKYVFYDNLLRRFFNQLDTLFIGKYFSAETLGFYSRAASLNSQVTEYTTSSLRKVLFSAFSKIQDDEELFKNNYLKVFHLSVFIGVLASGSLFILSDDIIILLLGEKWRPSVLIFQILVFRLLLSPFGGLIGKSLLAKGFSKEKFKLGQIRRVILLMPLFFGYMYGIHAFSIALVLAHLLAFLISMYAVYKLIKISFSLQLKSFFIPLLPIFFIVPAYYIFFNDKSSILLFLFYLVFQLGYFVLTRDAGLFIFISQVKILTKKINK